MRHSIWKTNEDICGVGTDADLNMKIHTVFNSKKEYLATFASSHELKRYIRRHKRDESDTTIITSELDSWNEFSESLRDTTKEWMVELYRDMS